MAFLEIDVHNWQELVTIVTQDAGTNDLKIKDADQTWDFNVLYPEGNIPKLPIPGGKIIDFNGLTVLRPYLYNQTLIERGGAIAGTIQYLNIINALCKNGTHLFIGGGNNAPQINLIHCQVSGTFIGASTDFTYYAKINANQCGFNLKFYEQANFQTSTYGGFVMTNCNTKFGGLSLPSNSKYLTIKDSRLIGTAPGSFIISTDSETSVIDMIEPNNITIISPAGSTATKKVLINSDKIRTTDYKTGFVQCTTEQLRSPSYLQSIGFPCES